MEMSGQVSTSKKEIKLQLFVRGQLKCADVK